jgi:hypothetical protein
MTPRSLFNIILKVFGLFFIKDVLGILPVLISFFNVTKRINGSDDSFLNISMLLIVVLIYILIAYSLIFKTTLLIDKLKLEKGFDQETIPINIHRSTILSISLIVIGGLMITQEVSIFCRTLFMYLQERQLSKNQINPFMQSIIISGAKIFIGLILVSNQKLIVNFIELKRKK